MRAIVALNASNVLGGIEGKKEERNDDTTRERTKSKKQKPQAERSLGKI